ncbi:hypothetical protein [Curtobacterium sp. MCBD17_040]|uniref:hypothetical protein n=1 Tax=Curtobacterium sp. MCBD17_040 TaxID=2175674 RepID=UPI0011B5808A|nr:hypothetical protein [Curtobacterium sp. MCBD17_040]WIB65433.1 hypothetical protein DEI94_18680 [Curtobacterium sp. MCBD17_040]
MTADSIIRKSHTGEAGNRGEFGTHRHDDDTIDLGVAGKGASLPAYEQEVGISWYEMGLPSSRHRKFVPIKQEGTHIVRIPQVSAADAPEAMTYISKDVWTKEETEHRFRAIDGELYRLVPGGADAVTGIARRESSGSQYPDRWGETVGSAKVRQQMDEAIEDFVLIDGEAWRRTPEPVYQVSNPGMGGSYAFINVAGAPDTSEEAASSDFFPADQYEEAVAFAGRFGHEVSGPDEGNRITPMNGFIPGSTWTPATRISFPDEPLYTLDSTQFASAFAEVRSTVESVPGAVTVVDDGRGGTRRKVDWTKFTAHQKSQYENYVTRAVEEGYLL